MMETQPLMNSLKGITIPKVAPWACAVPSRRNAAASSRQYFLPQTIAHRGNKAALPENSMAAFRSAVEVGAHAIETDAHLSRDGVVVLSHDPSLKRCFGVDRAIAECNWDFLSELRTLEEPRQPIPRLNDLLEWLVEGPETEAIWVLLDIKIDDAADELLGAIAKAFAQVPSSVPWHERIVLGCWNATFITSALSLLPGFPIAHISFSTSYSRHFLAIPNLGFNMVRHFLVGPLGAWFLRDVKASRRPVYAWTVNEDKWMEWCVRKNIPQEGISEPDGQASARDAVLIDGVITDDPRLFLDVCERLEDELHGETAPPTQGNSFRSSLGTIWELLLLNVLGTGLFLYRRLQGRFDLLKY